MKTPPPDFENLPYGPHSRQCLDVWVAEPRLSPIVVSVYGGGWMRGSKETTRKKVSPFLARGISVAAINYRLTEDTPFPGPFLDTARAVQFLRARQDELGIDGTRIGAFGSSAGGVNVLWTAFMPDLADPRSDDPIARQSSRLACVYAQETPTVLYPDSRTAGIPERAHEHPALESALGPLGFANPRASDILRAASPFFLANSDAPPVALSYGDFKKIPVDPKPGDGIHHPGFGPPLIQRLKELGVECSCLYHDDFPGLDSQQFGDIVVAQRLDFFTRHLLPS
jgi:acetyl esterase/lipase